MLQVEVPQSDGKLLIEETDVLGKCKTEVTKSTLDDTITILKSRDTGTCKGRPIYTTLDTTLYQEAQFVSGVSTATYELNSKKEIIYADVAQREFIYPLSKEPGQVVSRMMQTLEWKKTEDVDDCTEKSALRTREERSLVFSFSRSVRPEDDTSVEVAKEIIEKVPELPELPAQDIPETFLELIKTLRSLNREELQELNDTYVQYKKVDAPSSDETAAKEARAIMEKHSFFLDALAYVGTEPSLDLIVELASGSQGWFLNFTRKTELTWSIAAVPVHSVNACKVLNYSLELAPRNKTDQVPTLVLGSVMYKVLEIPNHYCEKELSIATSFLVNKLKENMDKIPDNFDLLKDTPENKLIVKYWERVVHTIKAFGNSGVTKTIKAVEKVLEQKKLQTEARTSAVYALKRVTRRNPLKVLDIATKVFSDWSEKEEVRIAAFTIVMEVVNSPNSPIVGQMQRQFMLKLVREPNPYVKSYACSYIKALEKTSDPSVLRLRTVLLLYAKTIGFLQTCLAEDKGYFSSRADFGYVSLGDARLPKSLPRDVMGVGFSSGVVFTPPVSPEAPASWLPRSGSIKLNARAFGYETDLLELGVRGTGIERLIQHLLGPAGYLRRGTRKMDVSGLPRDATKYDMIVDIPQENISASGFLKVLGNEIAWNHVEQGNIMRALYHNSPELHLLRKTITDATFDRFNFPTLRSILYKSFDYVRYLASGKLPIYHGKANLTKTVRMFDIKRSIPTILGLPLNLSVSAAGHMKLDAEAEVCYKNDAPLASMLWADCNDKIEAEGYIHPKLSMLSKVEVLLDAYEIQPKLVFCANASSDFKQRVKAVLHSNYTANVQLEEMPEMETVLLNASYVQYFETEGVMKVIGIEKRNKTEIYEPISGAGLTLLTNTSYPNSTALPLAPWFPLSGPANLTVFVRKTSSLLKGLIFTFWNETCLSFDKTCPNNDSGYFSFSIDAMGIGRTLDASAIWFTDPMKTIKFLNVTINSRPANFTAIIHSNPLNLMDMNSSVSLNTTVSNTTVFAIWNSTHVYGNVSRIRHTKDKTTALLKEPEFTLEMNASLWNRTYGNVSAVLFLEGSDKPQWLRSNFTVKGLMVNITAESSKFKKFDLGYVLPLPLRKPVCHVFNGHFITFDSLKFEHNLSPQCEYTLARHRHPNDTFAVTIQDKDIHLYVNNTKYTLTTEEPGLKVNGELQLLPYKVKHVIHVREVQQNNQKYIRLTAWAGVDIFYNEGDVQLSINGFFMNQTAGLCGNANYNGTVDDEMRGPDFQLAKSVQEFVQVWDLNDGQCESSPRTFPDTTDKANRLCSLYFTEVLTEASIHIDPTPFYNACLHDVSRGGSAKHSIRAYVMAAQSKSINLDACQYGQWEDWSVCKVEEGRMLHYRSRQVLANILRNKCITRETQDCGDEDRCILSKEHVVASFKSKVCKSTHRYPVCAEGCEPVRASGKAIEFKCVNSGEPLNKLDNASPMLLPFAYVEECRKTTVTN